jgi:homoserine kinase
LHQPYRAPLMADTAVAVEQLRAAGVAAAVSGAGPSIVCLLVRGEEHAARTAFASLAGWTVLDLEWDLEGARIVGA